MSKRFARTDVTVVDVLSEISVTLNEIASRLDRIDSRLHIIGNRQLIGHRLKRSVRN